MHAQSVGRTQKILEATQALLIEKGYERMTIKMVADRAGAAVGSITHFYKTKETLAAAVAKHLIDKLVADADEALKGHGNDEVAAVRSIIGACSNWPQKFRRYRDLVGYVEFGQRAIAGQRPDPLQGRLEHVLADWARSLIHQDKIAPFTSSQLYAVMIAPALCDVRFPAGPPKSRNDWIESLSRAALAALDPPQRKSTRKGNIEPARGSVP